MISITKRFYQRIKLLLAADFLKFVIAGILSVMLEFFILIVLVEKFDVNYLAANTVSFLITNIFNYLLSRFWVFGKSHRRIRYEILLFFSTTSVGLLINQGVMWVLVSHYQVYYKIAKLFAIVIVVIWNFWSKKFLVFTPNPKKQYV